jgi:hypothetical protein
VGSDPRPAKNEELTQSSLRTLGRETEERACKFGTWGTNTLETEDLEITFAG